MRLQLRSKLETLKFVANRTYISRLVVFGFDKTDNSQNPPYTRSHGFNLDVE